MMKEKTKDMERLVELFFDGATTTDEERRLYRYFAGRNVAPALEQYRDVFGDIGALSPHRKAHSVRLWRVIGGVAAVLLVAFAMSFVYQRQQLDRLEARYGGSYMIVDGQRIDNLRELQPHIESTLRMADEVEATAREDARNAERIVREAEESVLESIDDPVERERMRLLLN